ncbi:DUF320 domain-containing protein [Streptomyces sp. BHT-5-2]|uniref:chaplin family protein n=1 Tax=Streptomyces sp. BHT-5-2 TaxID=2866715 RepID=UPI001C8D96BE|nr:chaplin family protein [Streptomyces sp. BHT-5-2]QZL04299.1 DUF320 domain-containing protein [Streptomyces sp. BHT-5-2]
MKIRTLSAVACLVVGATLCGTGAAAADGGARGAAGDDPGTHSRNRIQIRVWDSFNICGNSILTPLLNPASRGTCGDK